MNDFVVHVGGARGAPASTIDWAGRLTPYDIETIGEHALRVGPMARVKVLMPPDAGEAVIAWVQEEFARFSRRGLKVSVRRQRVPKTLPRVGPMRPYESPHRPATTTSPAALKR